MLQQPTLDKMKALKLEAMAQAWLEQQKSTELQKLGFDERLGLLIEAEWLYRENKRLARCLKEAKLRAASACIEDIQYTAKRELDRAVIRQLATGRWVLEHQNVIITGMSGTGKTYISCALAQHACRQGHRAMYRRASRLFDELTLARADGTYARLLSRLARIDVLVIDDWGLSAPREQERQDLLEVLEDRCGVRSTIMTSQVPTNKWHEHLGEPTIADAICERILHNAHRLVLKGPSQRKEKEASTN
jgi:DNA replication protein DnaC